MIKTMTLSILLLLLGQSCATKQIKSSHRKSSKVVYSLMTKDRVGLESQFSENLKKSLNGEMLIKAIASLEKNKGDMQAIEFVENKGASDVYNIHMKDRNVPLKLSFSSKGKLDSVWINNIALKKGQ